MTLHWPVNSQQEAWSLQMTHSSYPIVSSITTGGMHAVSLLPDCKPLWADSRPFTSLNASQYLLNSFILTNKLASRNLTQFNRTWSLIYAFCKPSSHWFPCHLSQHNRDELGNNNLASQKLYNNRTSWGVIPLNSWIFQTQAWLSHSSGTQIRKNETSGIPLAKSSNLNFTIRISVCNLAKKKKEVTENLLCSETFISIKLLKLNLTL